VTIFDPSAGDGTRTDPAATANFDEGANGTATSVALPGRTRVRFFGDDELIKSVGSCFHQHHPLVSRSLRPSIERNATGARAER
jgi:hypothetical protein